MPQIDISDKPARESGREKEATSQNKGPIVHLIVFKLGNEEYGIPIEQVKEVTLTPPIARMPKTPSFIKGVANIRGDIIAVMDLEERFQLKVRNSGDSHSGYAIVTEIDDFTIGLVVKEVPQSFTVPLSQIEKTPQMIQEIIINEKYIEGIAKTDGRLIIVLRIDEILKPEEIQQLTI